MSRCPLCAFAWSSWKMRRRRLRFGCRVVVGSRPGCCSSPSAESPPRPPCWTSSSCCCACSSLLSSQCSCSLCGVARVAVCDELCLGSSGPPTSALRKTVNPEKRGKMACLTTRRTHRLCGEDAGRPESWTSDWNRAGALGGVGRQGSGDQTQCSCSAQQ
jgi:hypothetical protein